MNIGAVGLSKTERRVNLPEIHLAFRKPFVSTVRDSIEGFHREVETAVVTETRSVKQSSEASLKSAERNEFKDPTESRICCQRERC